MFKQPSYTKNLLTLTLGVTVAFTGLAAFAPSTIYAASHTTEFKNYHAGHVTVASHAHHAKHASHSPTTVPSPRDTSSPSNTSSPSVVPSPSNTPSPSNSNSSNSSNGSGTTSPAAPTNPTAPTADPSSTIDAASPLASKIIATGKKFLGVPYKFGAKSGNTNEFDCSSFTQYIFKQNGITLPRNSRQQSQVGTVVSKSQLKPGDLVFSDTNNDGTINHVSLYIGNGKLLHTYQVGIGVTISNFDGSFWDKHFVTARRVL